MDLGIQNKIALVTGAALGIGKATAKALLEEGVKVVLSDVKEEELKQTAQELSQIGKLWSHPADITNIDDLKQLHDFVQKEVGKIDILVQNAGIVGEQGEFHELSDDDWVNTLEHDLLGPVRVVREFLPDLRSKGWGRIALLSSENGEQPYKDELPYNCTKAGILSFAKGLSKTYAKEGILVNAVSPAFIETPMTDGMVKETAEENNISFDEAINKMLDELKPHLELKRRGHADEVASVITFLCSEKASFINGANYRVDGGSVATI